MDKCENNIPLTLIDGVPVTEQYLCVLDFEASCWKEGNRGNMEIIEFPSILCKLVTKDNTTKLIIISEFHQYVKPMIITELSDFCTELTGISQAMVSSALPFLEVYNLHNKWLKSHVTQNDNVTIVTCGAWDLKTMLPQELRRYPHLQHYSEYNKFINIKTEFEHCYGTNKITGMTGMLKHLGIQLEGRHHSGIDDCRNIQRILAAMVADGYITFHPYNINDIDEHVIKNQEKLAAQRAEKLKKRHTPKTR